MHEMSSQSTLVKAIDGRAKSPNFRYAPKSRIFRRHWRVGGGLV